MEIQQLQVTVERETQVRQQIEENLKQAEAELIIKTEFVFSLFSSY